jgi:hypothetical protein
MVCTFAPPRIHDAGFECIVGPGCRAHLLWPSRPSVGDAAQTLGYVAALQFVYVAVGLTLHLVRFGKLIPHAQTAIGDRLRAELEVPRGLTPELSVLVARLDLS